MPVPIASVSGSKANTARQAGGSPPASAVVAGAGTSAANGTYTYSGLEGGKSYYNKSGTNPVLSAISFDPGEPRWAMYDNIGNFVYSAPDEVDFPWLATWGVADGDPPAPTVTEG